MEINDTVCQINENALIESGLSIHYEELFEPTIKEVLGRKRILDDDSGKRNNICEKLSAAHPKKIHDREVKRCTGSVSMEALLSFIYIVVMETYK